MWGDTGYIKNPIQATNHLPNTLVYAVKQCISVFLISKYNVDSDFCLCL